MAVDDPTPDDADELLAALIECVADGLPNRDADVIPLSGPRPEPESSESR